jgi:3-methyladenine DNA glycosylase AlkC
MKNAIGAEAVRELSTGLRAAWRAFDAAGFEHAALEGLAELELTERARHVADVLRAHLPREVPRALELLVRTFPEPASPDGKVGLSALRFFVHSEFVARHALEHVDEALVFMRELTQRFTAEFAIRPYIEREPQRLLAVLAAWARDEDVHVRRLVSEGTRPRLPWGKRLRVFEADPAPVLELLEVLRDDPSEYVRRSVANHLNDIGKDRPDVLLDVAERWLADAPAPRAKLVKHALRSLVKAGDTRALALLGAGRAAKVEIERATFTPRRVKLGGELVLAVELSSTARSRQDLLVDYAIHYVKANGERRAKVFKGRRFELAAGERTTLRFTRSFADMTTRRHHPGTHAAELLVNGARFPLGEFDVVR